MIASAPVQRARLEDVRRRWDRVVLLITAPAAVAVGMAAGELASVDRISAMLALAALAMPFAVWRRPAFGVLGLACAGLLVEQYRIGAPSGDLTDRIPWFTSLSDGFKLSGVYVNPAELGIFSVATVLIAQGIRERRLRAPAGYVAGAFAVLLVAVMVGVVRGLTGGGDMKMTLWEIRPFLYVFLLYLLTLQLRPSYKLLLALQWCLVIGTGFKALQGMVVLLIKVAYPTVQRPDYLLSHDDAFFFGMELTLVACLWLFNQPGRLRTVATGLAPLVLVIDMANSRRSAWVILAAALLLCIVMTAVRLPERRRAVATAVVVGGAAFAIYLPPFWNGGGLISQPARAVRSAIAPSERDRLSDLYRVQENANLAINIRRSTPLGVGFGIPIDYVLPIVDLTRADPFLAYIPHDGILYVWMRLGVPGFIAWWFWVGAVAISAAKLLRAADLRLACFAVLASASVAGYVIEGYYDLGLFWFRMAFFMGGVIGLLQLAHHLDREGKLAPPIPVAADTAADRRHFLRVLSVSTRGPAPHTGV